MLKSRRQSIPAQTKHQQEMATLRAYHECVMRDSALREAALVESGVFVRGADGTLVVAKRYAKVILPKGAA